MDKKMNTKNLLVSFVVIAMALFLVSTVSALTIDKVTVDGIEVYEDYSDVSLVAGETATVKVYFTADADEDLSEVVVKAELGDSEVETAEFDVVAEKTYKKTLNIEVPYDFDDEELTVLEDLEITIESDGDEVELNEEFMDECPIVLTIQKPSYNVEIKPIHVPSSVEAGETFSVNVVVENNGYNDLEDLYITATSAELGIDERFYIGDLVNSDEEGSTVCEWTSSGWECDDDDGEANSAYIRLELEVPYNVQAGEYNLEISVSNEDANVVDAAIVVTENSLPNQVIKTDTGLIIVNPTDKVAVYTVESTANVEPSTVVVEAGSSERVTVTSETAEEFTVSVFAADGELISTVAFSGSVANDEEAIELESPVVVLTVVLAIIFLVLLVVLIVLITKKPEKAEEFGESYY